MNQNTTLCPDVRALAYVCCGVRFAYDAGKYGCANCLGENVARLISTRPAAFFYSNPEGGYVITQGQGPNAPELARVDTLGQVRAFIQNHNHPIT